MKQILVIDDDPMALELLETYLAGDEFIVKAFSNGDAGIQEAKEMHFDLAIVDMVMPDMDGLQTILELRKLRSDLPVIAISGGGVIPKERYLSVASCLDEVETLPKPFLKKELLTLIQRLAQ